MIITLTLDLPNGIWDDLYDRVKENHNITSGNFTRKSLDIMIIKS